VIAGFVVETERDEERKWKIRAVTETKQVLVESRENYLWAKVV
jgi:hypothetical protein